MLDTVGHEKIRAYGSNRESRQETIREHAARTIGGAEYHHNRDERDGKVVIKGK